MSEADSPRNEQSSALKNAMLRYAKSRRISWSVGEISSRECGPSCEACGRISVSAARQNEREWAMTWPHRVRASQ